MNKYRLSVDSILFLALVAAYMWLGEVARLVPENTASDSFLIVGLWRVVALPIVMAPTILALGCYLCADVFAEQRRAYVIKSIIAWIVILLFTILPTVLAIYMRRMTQPYLFVHDGQIQIEEAAKLLLAGKNPYGANYLNTPMAQWPFHEQNLALNPALFHFAYLPLSFLFLLPFDLIARALIGWFDLRLLFIPLLIGTLLVLQRTISNNRQKLALLLFAGLNPLFVPFFVEGRTEILVLFPLVLSVFLLQHEHQLASLVVLALACAIKQTAWFIAPFYLVYYLQMDRQRTIRETLKEAEMRLRSVLLQMVAAAGVFALIVLPFVAWDPSKFVEDVLRYPTGLGEFAYPINSLGLGGIALAMGWIPSNLSPFRFEWLQLTFGIPALLALWWFQLGKNDTARLWLSYGLFFLLIGFFSHVFNDNHLGYAITLLATGMLSGSED